MTATNQQINTIRFLLRELNLDRDYNYTTMTSEEADKIVEEIKRSREYKWAFGDGV